MSQNQKKIEITRLIVPIVQELGIRARLLFLSGEFSTWARWIQQPSPGYVELEGVGPVPLRLVASIELDAIQEKNVGRLLAKKTTNLSQEIMVRVKSLGLDYFLLEADNVVRIEI
jgi:hypothetical protein